MREKCRYLQAGSHVQPGPGFLPRIEYGQALRRNDEVMEEANRFASHSIHRPTAAPSVRRFFVSATPPYPLPHRRHRLRDDRPCAGPRGTAPPIASPTVRTPPSLPPQSQPQGDDREYGEHQAVGGEKRRPVYFGREGRHNPVSPIVVAQKRHDHGAEARSHPRLPAPEAHTHCHDHGLLDPDHCNQLRNGYANCPHERELDEAAPVRDVCVYEESYAAQYQYGGEGQE